jgi:hypothetical protein
MKRCTAIDTFVFEKDLSGGMVLGCGRSFRNGE